MAGVEGVAGVEIQLLEKILWPVSENKMKPEGSYIIGVSHCEAL